VVVYHSFGAFAEPQSAVVSAYRSARDPQHGWTTRAIVPPVTTGVGFTTLPAYAYQAFSPELTVGALIAGDPPLVPGAQRDTVNLYLRNLVEGGYGLLTPPGDMTGFRSYSPHFADASSDFTHVIFESSAVLTPDASSGVVNLYEWASGAVRLVGVRPDGTVASEGSFAGEWEPEPAYRGASGANYTQNTISADGSKIFWTDSSDGQLYLRENGTTTAHASASRRTDCADHNPCTGAPEPDPAGPQPAVFQTATADGAIVLFTSDEKLTTDSTADASHQSSDLYAYKANGGELTDLTVDPNPADEHGAEVGGVIGMSEDASYVYFMASGQLAPGAPAGIGNRNVYLWHDGETKYVATMPFSFSSIDPRNWQRNTTLAGGFMNSRVTADGKHLLLTSTSKLTGYENTDAVTGEGHSEIYLYDAATEKLRCVSCNTAQPAATGDAAVSAGQLYASGSVLAPFFTRALSSTGGRAIFETSEALVPQDTNGKVDVYEWEEHGTGGCREEGGCVSLISSGKGPGDSHFADASTDGRDVFFTTDEQLASNDHDHNVDVYDARVEGGFPAPDAPTGCEGDECQGPLGAPPMFGVPSSTTLTGTGNVTSVTASPQTAKHKVKTASQIRAEKLAKALKACRAKPKSKSARKRCEAHARKRYGAKRASRNRRGN
jgi:hypothetical protein